MSRTEQESALTGDPVKGQQVGREMRAKYLNNPSVPPQGQPQ
jgi:hypothetical protein